MRLRVVGELAGRARADGRGRRRRGDPHHDRRADARRRRRHRDGRAHRTRSDGRRRRARHARGRTRAARAPCRRRPRGRATWCSNAGTVLDRRAPRRARDASVRAACTRSRARVGVLSTGDELVESGGPLAPGKIRDSNRPMLLAQLADAGAEPVDLGIARDDEPTSMTRTLADAVAQLRRGDHERRGVGRRLRLRERRRSNASPRRPDGRITRRLVPGRDQAREAAVLRHAARHAGLRPPRQPGVVVRELRAVRPACAAADDGPRPSVPPRGARHRRRHRCGVGPTASSTSTASSSTWSTAPTWPPGCVRRRATRSAASAAANGLALLPDGDGVAKPATPSPSCCSTDRSATSRSERERAPGGPKPPGARLPARPRRAAPPPRAHGSPDRTIQPVCTVQPPGMSGCSPAGTLVTDEGRHLDVTLGDGAAAALHDCRVRRSFVRLPPWSPGNRRSRVRARRRRAPRIRRGVANADHGSCCHDLPSRVSLPGTNNRPSRTDLVRCGAGFALAPRKLKRPIRRLRIDASP